MLLVYVVVGCCMCVNIEKFTSINFACDQSQSSEIRLTVIGRTPRFKR